MSSNDINDIIKLIVDYGLSGILLVVMCWHIRHNAQEHKDMRGEMHDNQRDLRESIRVIHKRVDSILEKLAGK